MNTTPKTAKTAKAESVGLNIEIPADVHRRAKAAAALARMTWNEAVSEALAHWSIARIAKGGGR
jgi:predicted HicB family RNase H-like nuclease